MQFVWFGDGAGTKSDWDDGRNWRDLADNVYAEARYPGSVTDVHDDVLFRGVLGATALSPLGYDGSALARLRSLEVAPDYDGSIGGAGDWLAVPTDGLVLNGTQAGSIYIERIDGADTDTTIVRSGSGIHLRGTFENFRVMKGSGSFDAGVPNVNPTIVDNGWFGYETLSGINTDVVWIINEGVTISNITQSGGVVTNYNGITTFTQNGGVWYHYGRGNTQSGNILHYNGYGGILYPMESSVCDALLAGASIDASTRKLPGYLQFAYVGPNSVINIENGLGNIRVTGNITNNGGTIITPTGKSVSIVPAIAMYEQGLAPHTGTESAMTAVGALDNTWTCNGHGLVVGDEVMFAGTGGGVTAELEYFVKTCDANTFTISVTMGGTTFDVIDTTPNNFTRAGTTPWMYVAPWDRLLIVCQGIATNEASHTDFSITKASDELGTGSVSSAGMLHPLVSREGVPSNNFLNAGISSMPDGMWIREVWGYECSILPYLRVRVAHDGTDPTSAAITVLRQSF